VATSSCTSSTVKSAYKVGGQGSLEIYINSLSAVVFKTETV